MAAVQRIVDAAKLRLHIAEESSLLALRHTDCLHGTIRSSQRQPDWDFREQPEPHVELDQRFAR
jgi:hypothetical protein